MESISNGKDVGKLKLRKCCFAALLVLAVLCPAVPGEAAVRYVKQGGTGNGTSWADASSDLKGVMNAAQSGDELWVAAGLTARASTRMIRSF